MSCVTRGAPKPTRRTLILSGCTADVVAGADLGRTLETMPPRQRTTIPPTAGAQQAPRQLGRMLSVLQPMLRAPSNASAGNAKDSGHCPGWSSGEILVLVAVPLKHCAGMTGFARAIGSVHEAVRYHALRRREEAMTKKDAPRQEW
jgi:hypothetical protein